MRLTHPAPLAVSALLLAALAPLAAQTGGVTVPAKARVSAPGPTDRSFERAMFWVSENAATPHGRVQYVYDHSEVNTATTVFRAMRVRNSHISTTYDMTLDLELTLAHSSRGSTGAVASFALNADVGATQVFKAKVSIPGASPGSWPRPWAFTIPFTRTFLYSSTVGRALVVEAIATNGSAPWPWTMEGYERESGWPHDEWGDARCRTRSGHRGNGIGFDPDGLIPGGRFVMQLGGYPRFQNSLATNMLAFGSQGRGGTWGSIRLPFDLNAFGIPSPAYCRWSVDVLTTTTMTYDQAAGTLDLFTPIPIPNDPLLAGRSFYTQNAALDLGPQLFPSTAIRWEIGTGRAAPTARIQAAWGGSTPPAFGTVTRGTSATLRFE